MKRTATAVWQGTLKEGNGTIATQSKVLNNTPYSFRSRFGDGVETNPEELIAAAHAGCFTMASRTPDTLASRSPSRQNASPVLVMHRARGGGL